MCAACFILLLLFVHLDGYIEVIMCVCVCLRFCVIRIHKSKLINIVFRAFLLLLLYVEVWP